MKIMEEFVSECDLCFCMLCGVLLYCLVEIMYHIGNKNVSEAI